MTGFVIEGHIQLQPADPTFPGIVTYMSTDAVVTSPVGLSNFNVAFPSWGTVYSDGSIPGNPQWTATSLIILVQPSSHIDLTPTMLLDVFDVTSGTLLETVTMYKGGADFVAGVAIYLQRPVANSTLVSQPWPEYPLDNSPQGTDPFAASNNNLIRYTFSDGPPTPPPFPPYLPPSPPWPTITPAPTPPTASFPPGQPANQVLGIGANYSIFSNFGHKG